MAAFRTVDSFLRAFIGQPLSTLNQPTTACPASSSSSPTSTKG